MTKIACWNDFNEGFKPSGSKCPARSEWENESNIDEGYSVKISGSYADNQLVKLSDITVGIELLSTIHVGAYYGSYPNYLLTAKLIIYTPNPELLVNSETKPLPVLGLTDEGSIDAYNTLTSYSHTSYPTDSLGYQLQVVITGNSPELNEKEVYLYQNFDREFYKEPDKDGENSISTFNYSSDDNNYVAYFNYYNKTEYVHELNNLDVDLVVMMESYPVQT